MNVLAFANLHSGVSNLVWGIAKEQKIAGTQMFAVYSDQAAPCGLQISISGHHYGSAAHQHSGIATAVRFNNGPQFQMRYTFAKSLNTRSFDPAFSTVPTGTFAEFGKHSV